MTNKSHSNRQPLSAHPRYGIILGVALVFTALSLAFGSPADSKNPASPQFEGSFDKLEVASVGGWAWDAARPNVAIKVEIYDGATLLATVTAEGFRADLKSAGKGDGKHAFNYALPLTLRDGQSHTISVKYAGTASELPGSPRTLLFPKS
jgi:hypothetical protein